MMVGTSSLPPAFEGGRLRWNSERRDELLSSLGGLRPYASTGFSSLDRLLGGGLCPGLHVLSALPGSGKSTFALMIGDHIARFGTGSTLVATLEMSAASLVCKSIVRLSAEQGGVPLTFPEVARLVRRPDAVGSPRFEILTAAADAYFEQIAPSVAMIDDAVTVDALARIYDAFPAAERKPCLIVDYVQLLRHPDGDTAATDYAALTATVTDLCAIAQRHSVPILCISSQNRGAKRGGASLDLLSGSSALEYASSTASFLTVDGEDDSERQRNAEVEPRPVCLHVLKNRFGPCGRIPMWFFAAEARFTEREG